MTQKTQAYELTWITSQLAAGHAPMTYEELASIREQGIDAIINLCGEFSDLHVIEEKAGFEVYHLAIPDESIPELEELQNALAWLDEALYLKKKVLVHCRHGHGRTGTLISAYLVRRGLDLKQVDKLLKHSRASPANFSQWRLVRRFQKQEGVLSAAPASPLSPQHNEMIPFLREYEAIAEELDREIALCPPASPCGRDNVVCCADYFELSLVESLFLQELINRRFSSDARELVIERSVEIAGVIKTLRLLHERHEKLRREEFAALFALTDTRCPLFLAGHCSVERQRPFRCRWQGSGLSADQRKGYEEMLNNLAHNIFLALTGSLQPMENLSFSMADTVSGRFIETCFRLMAGNHRGERHGST